MRPPKDENARSAKLSKILENLRLARNAVHSCLVLVNLAVFHPANSGLPWEERAGRSRKVFDAEETMAASLPAIDFIIEGVEADIGRLAVSAGRPKDEWKALFVAALALGWEKLTGKLPGQTTAGGDFVNFLSAAWASLPGGEPPEINWERPIYAAFAGLRQSPGRLQNLPKLALRKSKAALCRLLARRVPA